MLLLDPEDEWLRDAFVWSTSGNYIAVMRDRVVIRLHHCIVGMPVDPNIQVDHINRDRMDNRRSNLRYVTKGDNHRNSARGDAAKRIYQLPSGSYRVEVQHERYVYGSVHKTLAAAVAKRDAIEKELGI